MGVLPRAERRRYKRLNNRTENSHLPTRKRERVLQRFKSAEHAQRLSGSFQRCFLTTSARVDTVSPPACTWPGQGSSSRSQRRDPSDEPSLCVTRRSNLRSSSAFHRRATHRAPPPRMSPSIAVRACAVRRPLTQVPDIEDQIFYKQLRNDLTRAGPALHLSGTRARYFLSGHERAASRSRIRGGHLSCAVVQAARRWQWGA
jgi:hypothetical protein